ncbi:hypothetical protein DL98DRAFT_67694 [Cadophora sp. DSE1049]|nr:hypothetical protein DL98DRAFT_67694 [Cadophora sp. DSE1049]
MRWNERLSRLVRSEACGCSLPPLHPSHQFTLNHKRSISLGNTHPILSCHVVPASLICLIAFSVCLAHLIRDSHAHRVFGILLCDGGLLPSFKLVALPMLWRCLLFGARMHYTAF